MSTPIITISNLDFAFGQRLVLKHINLTIEGGSLLGVIGPNGGGKTTLVKLLLGLIEPARGSISIGGLSPRQAVRRGNVVGYLPQNPSVPPDFPLSVRQLIRLGLTGKTGLLKADSKEDIAHADLMLNSVGVEELADRPVGELSGGQLQRVFIARALAAKPHVLVLDEPTTGIDRSGQQQFVEFLLRLRKDLQLTIVMVSHDLRTVSAIADRIACLNVTLHYHDVPHAMPAELASSMFGCDLEAMGLNRKAPGRPPLVSLPILPTPE